MHVDTGSMKHKNLPVYLETLSHQIIGCAIKVHRNLGPGLLESIYEHALMYELALAGIRAERQVSYRVPYMGTLLPELRVDTVVERAIRIELKSAEAIKPTHLLTLLSYLRLTGLPLGLAINFNVMVLKDGLRRVMNERSEQFKPTDPSS